MNSKKFISNLMNLVSIQSESYNTKSMARHIVKIVQSIGGCTISYDSYKNIYVTKGKAKDYPCMVCHIDTVHDIVKAKVIPINVNGNIIAVNNNTLEQIGTGGDDKVGIHITLELLKQIDTFKCAFFLDEEVGCVGSSQADFDFFSNTRYVLECDRRGNDDFVNSISSTKLYTKEFSNDISKILKKYDRKETSGGMTDVLEIAYETDLCVANMSCGYYKPHTDGEYINIDDVIATYNLCYDLFTKVTKKYKYSDIRSSYSYGGNRYNYNSHYHMHNIYDKEDLIVEKEFDCGIGCGMENGFCTNCNMSSEEIKEFWYET